MLYIHFWCKTTPYWLYSDPAAVAQNKDGRGSEPFFYVPKWITLLKHFLRRQFFFIRSWRKFYWYRHFQHKEIFQYHLKSEINFVCLTVCTVIEWSALMATWAAKCYRIFVNFHTELHLEIKKFYVKFHDPFFY